tara:strand:- start:437 stop:1462 length:1026 start_codon:yes stop_codon:yes gene_type:complete
MKNFILVIILIFSSKCIYSKNLFETQFYTIDFTSNNIENDKINEIKKIKTQSILFIFKNILDNKNYQNIINLVSDDLTNTLVKNILINDEKIINNKYFAKIKINFNKKKIIDFLRSNGVPYIEYYPDKFLLIIYELDGINNNLFTKNNNYYKYFNGNSKYNNFFLIPNLDINDRFILKEEHIIDKNLKKIINFSKKYKSNEIVIVISKKNKFKIENELLLYSQDNLIETKLINKTDNMELFFETLKKETLNLWKQVNGIQNKYVNNIKCKVQYFNKLELKEIRNNLDNVSIIKNLNIKTISYQNIEYEIFYYGNINILFKIFELNKLKFSNSTNNCTIRLK